jgi:uncharacterized membrane protein
MNQTQIVGLGTIIIFIGILVIFGSTLFAPQGTKSDTKFSVFGIFGFIPFGFSNDKRLFILSIILAIVLVVFSFLMFYKK